MGLNTHHEFNFIFQTKVKYIKFYNVKLYIDNITHLLWEQFTKYKDYAILTVHFQYLTVRAAISLCVGVALTKYNMPFSRR